MAARGVPVLFQALPPRAQSPLSDRQFDLAWKLAMGHSTYRDLARLTGLAWLTIKNELSAAYQALGLGNETELALWAIRETGVYEAENAKRGGRDG